MNTTTTAHTETQPNAALYDTLLYLESDHTEVLIEVHTLRKLLYFMESFFEDEDLDPNSEDRKKQISALDRIIHFPQYRSLFDTIVEKSTAVDKKVEKVSRCIGEALDTAKSVCGITSIV